MTVMSGEGKRLFVGNLFPEVAPADLEKLFSRFGRIASSEIKNKTDIDGNVVSTFAFVNLSADSAEGAVRDCIRECNGLRWKQRSIRVQAAQESFMQRLARERKERIANFSTEEDPSYSPLEILKNRQQQIQQSTEDAEDYASSGLSRQKASERGRTRLLPRSASTSKPTPSSRSSGGVIEFKDNDEDNLTVQKAPLRLQSNKRVYHSSSDEDDEGRETKSKAAFQTSFTGATFASPKFEDRRQKTEVTRPSKVKKDESAKPARGQAVKRKRYYSSSDDDDDQVAPRANSTAQKKSSNILSKLESFNSGIWGEEEQDSRSKRNKSEKTDETIIRKPIRDEDAKRLKSLKKRQEELRAGQSRQTDVIKKALSQAGGSSNKKVFLDEEEPASKTALFDDNDEDNEEEDHFKIRPQFHGKHGDKLLSLQSKFASDDRFRIDSRFKEDDDDDDHDDEAEEREVKDVDVEDMTAEQERSRNMSILEGIVGKAKIMKKKAATTKFVDMSQNRFDPENADHRKKLELSKEKEDSEGSETEMDNDMSSGEKMEKKEVPEVDSGKKFWLSKDAFTKGKEAEKPGQKKTGGSSFSFGFGSGETKSLNEGKKYPQTREEDRIEKKGSQRLDFLSQNPFQYDSSSSDEEDEDESKKVGIKSSRIDELSRKLAAKTSAASSSSLIAERFFFCSDISKDEEVAEFMGEGKTAEELRENYDKERPLLAATLKKKVRRKAKRQKLAFSTKSTASNNADGRKRPKWKKPRKIIKKK